MKEREIERLFNKALCERYPFLQIRSLWDDEPINNGFAFTWLNEMEPGWRKAFGIQMMEEIRDVLIQYDCLDKMRIVQIKEKFGGLRFYVNVAPEEVYKIIDRYEELSFKVCQFCGAPAETEDYHGCLTTWCKDCKANLLRPFRISLFGNPEIFIKCSK